MNRHRAASRRGRWASSGHAHDITGSSWKAAVSTATTSSRSPSEAARIDSSAIARTVGDEFATRRSSAGRMTTGFAKDGLTQLDRVMAGHAGAGAAGLVWGVARDGEMHVDVAGTT